MSKDLCSISINGSNSTIENSSSFISISKVEDFISNNVLNIEVTKSENAQRIDLASNSSNTDLIDFEINLIINEGAVLEFVDESSYSNNSNIRLISQLHKNSYFELYKLNNYNNENINKFYHNCSLLENSTFKDYSFSNGSKENFSKTIINLNDVNSRYLGSGVSINSSTNSDTEIEIRHNTNSTSSDCYFKTVAKGSSKVNFDGTIFVDNHCSKTISNQVSKGLLIGKESKINLTPKLEIYNDDVECSHGAASGQPDKNTLFYLTSRGISKEEAEQIYVEGFLSEFFETIDNISMAEKAKNFINLNT
jgi:Fe-S cluster assembly protein SufD